MRSPPPQRLRRCCRRLGSATRARGTPLAGAEKWLWTSYPCSASSHYDRLTDGLWWDATQAVLPAIREDTGNSLHETLTGFSRGATLPVGPGNLKAIGDISGFLLFDKGGETGLVHGNRDLPEFAAFNPRHAR